MSGPPPKRERQRTNTPAIGLVATTPTGTAYPAPPSEFLASTKKAWEEFWNSPLANVVVPSTDGPAMRRLFGMYDERERLARGVREQGRMIKGSKDQLVLNPMIREIASLDAEIRQLEDRFGMSPLARLRLGLAFGEAVNSLAALNASLEADDTEEPDIRVVEVIAASE